MPPRYAYWTIIADGLPTAFRAARREELLPTFSRIKQKHPDAEMKWFARGKLWESPESARQNRDAGNRGRRPDHSRPPKQSASSGAADGFRPERRPARPGERARGRDWRPGGEHRDPRQKYKQAKTARNVEHRRRKFARRNESDQKRDRSDWQQRENRRRPPELRGADAGRDKWPKRSAAGRKEDRGASKRFPSQREGGPAFEKRPWVRNQGTEEPSPPPRPRGPSREPRPQEGTEPTPPPRPTEPVTTPPGPPERGQRNKRGE